MKTSRRWPLLVVTPILFAACSLGPNVKTSTVDSQHTLTKTLTQSSASYVSATDHAGGVVLSLTEADVRVEPKTHDLDVTGLDGTRFLVVGPVTYIDARDSSGVEAFVKADNITFERLGVSAARAESEHAMLALLAALPEQVNVWASNIKLVTRVEETYTVTVQRAAVVGISKTDLRGDPSFEFIIDKTGKLKSWGLPGAKQQQLTVSSFERVTVNTPTNIVKAPHL